MHPPLNIDPSAATAFCDAPPVRLSAGLTDAVASCAAAGRPLTLITAQDSRVTFPLRSLAMTTRSRGSPGRGPGSASMPGPVLVLTGCRPVAYADSSRPRAPEPTRLIAVGDHFVAISRTTLGVQQDVTALVPAAASRREFGDTALESAPIPAQRRVGHERRPGLLWGFDGDFDAAWSQIAALVEHVGPERIAEAFVSGARTRAVTSAEFDSSRAEAHASKEGAWLAT